ncbi:MAG: amidohydrolase [Acidobacteria bacterium]|nr:amidohydrolase [Acidobacteriota bacterium]
MRIIDFHNHFYPKVYLDAVRKGPSAVRVTMDDAGNPWIHSPGDINIIVPGHRDIEYREKVLNDHGIDTQVLTFTSPGVDIETPKFAVRMSSQVNDSLASMVRAKKGRFTALATLPLNDPKGAVPELRRAMEKLGMRGAMLFSNVNGRALADQAYWPMYEVANELGAVLYIHPTYPLAVEAMSEYWLMPLVGFLFDTTLAAARLIFAGVVERFPRITWVLAHLGGAIPYLAERLDRGFRAFKDCRVNIARPPSEYLKQFYYDTVNFDPRAIELAIAFAGADHILAGSDYPHQIGSLELMLSSIRSLQITEADRANILGGNTARLLKL